MLVLVVVLVVAALVGQAWSVHLGVRNNRSANETLRATDETLECIRELKDKLPPSGEEFR